MSEQQQDWGDRNLSPGSKRFIAWWCIVTGAMGVLVAPIAIFGGEWVAGLGSLFFGAISISESVRRLRRIPAGR